LGGVAGTLLATFSLLEALGTRGTLWVACVVNALVGLAAVRWSGTGLSGAAIAPPPAAETLQSPAAGLSVPAGRRKERKRRRREEDRARPPDPRVLRAAVPPTRFVLGAAAITGFAFTLMELVWYRMLAPLLSGSTYTFGLILAVALLV